MHCESCGETLKIDWHIEVHAVEDWEGCGVSVSNTVIIQKQ